MIGMKMFKKAFFVVFFLLLFVTIRFIFSAPFRKQRFPPGSNSTNAPSFASYQSDVVALSTRCSFAALPLPHFISHLSSRISFVLHSK